jgi:hypothetical protein
MRNRHRSAMVSFGVIAGFGLVACAGCAVGQGSLSKLAWWRKDDLNLTANHEDYQLPASHQSPTPRSQLAGGRDGKLARDPYVADAPQAPKPISSGTAQSSVSIEYPSPSGQGNASVAASAPGTDGRSASGTAMPGRSTVPPSTLATGGAPGTNSFVPVGPNSGSFSASSSPYTAAASGPSAGPADRPAGYLAPANASTSAAQRIDTVGTADPVQQAAASYEYPSTPHAPIQPGAASNQGLPPLQPLVPPREMPGSLAPAGAPSASSAAPNQLTPINPAAAQSTAPFPSRNHGAAAASNGSQAAPRTAQLPQQLLSGQGTYWPGSVPPLNQAAPDEVQVTVPASSSFGGGSFQPH